VSGRLDKAVLQPLSAGREPEAEGDPVEVQFNPASLRLQMQNAVEGGRTQTRPAEQYVGASSTTLSLELHFDTADEGTTDHPVNVQTRTAKVAQFVLPRAKGENKAPPRVRFCWGDLVFDGVMTSFSEELDLFAQNGVPLRAKVSVSISKQDPKFESVASEGGGFGLSIGAGFEIGGGIGLGVGGGVRLGAGGAGGGLGFGAGAGVSLAAGGAAAPRIGVALAGESPADFAARMGLDPTAWRTVAAPGGLRVSLDAGTEVAFAPGAGPASGVGTARGGGESAPRAALDRVAGPAPSEAAREGARTGFALASAGGLDAALQIVHQARADAASTAERRAFAAAEGPAPLAPSAGRAPLRAGEVPRAGRGPTAPAAPVPPRADERAASFGAGVPLRPRRGTPTAGRAVLARRAPVAAPAPPLPPRCGCGCGGAP
jgi:Contractile injection system tube protein